MDELHLSETLQRYFSDVFLCCDEDKTGNASLQRTIELIKSGSVPDEIINQISELCWNHQNVHLQQLTRKEFYSALKLVAAYQANIPITVDLLTKNLELPLPRFSWNSSENDLIELNSDKSDYIEHLDANSTDSEVDSDTLSLARNGSPEISSTASDSPTPTNSVQDRSWAHGGVWQGLVSEEQRQLLGTEEESSDRHSSEEDTEINNEIWTINQEQREYYTNQFRSLQPDLNALLAGPVARMFFEKSRLPVHELRKIWQLADVTKDGALSLQEFNTAMHLVVLRRNHIELPDILPPTLIPGNETPLSVSPETEPILSPQTKDTAKEWTKFVDSPTSSISSPGPKPVNFDFQKITLDKDSKIFHPVPLRLTPEISGTSTSTTTAAVITTTTTTTTTTIQQQTQPPISSSSDDIDGEPHSPKKFIDNTNNITTNSNTINSAIQRPQPKKINLPGPGAIPPPPSQNNNNHQEDGPISLPAFPPPKKDKPPPPPPRPFKTHGRSSSLDLNRLTKLGAPPTVPPRISPNIQSGKKLINQRSEGDCGFNHHNNINNSNSGGGGGGGGVAQFANFDNFEQYENVPDIGDLDDPNNIFGDFSTTSTISSASNSNQIPRKHGAFEIYRKPTQSVAGAAAAATAAAAVSAIPPFSGRNKEPGSSSSSSVDEKSKWELYEKLQAENRVLLRICQELSQELADIREEKLTLKMALEKQKEQQQLNLA